MNGSVLRRDILANTHFEKVQQFYQIKYMIVLHMKVQSDNLCSTYIRAYSVPISSMIFYESVLYRLDMYRN